VLAGLLLFTDCSNESVGPKPNGDISDPVFNDDGGFVLTEMMLDKRYNEISYPGTHNSFAGADWIGTCENQNLTIAQQLEHGIRYIELDLEASLYVYHGGCRGYLHERLEQIRDYARAHRNQVITVRVSDIEGLSAYECFHRLNGRLEDTGLANDIYNWDATKDKTDWRRCYVPDPWPTLREIIDAGKNVMFFHHRDSHPVFDQGLTQGLSYSDGNLYWFYNNDGDLEQEQFCMLMPVWSPPRERQHDGPNRLFLAEVCPDGGESAGSMEASSKNNDGRKLYQLAKHLEEEILPDNRCVNFVNVDYFRGSHAGVLPIDVVDACNRLNYERFGISWKTADCFWELQPYEFDNSKTEYIGRASGISDEVNAAIYDHEHHVNLDGLEDKGQVVSTTYHTVYEDWKRIPEWAVDNDYFTRWCGSSSGDNHTWGIDLGQRRPATEIAIAWEYPHKMPAYTVYGSNYAGFEDGMSDDELLDDTNWEVLGQEPMLMNIPAKLWVRTVLDPTSSNGWRFYKIKVTNADSERWPSFWEVKLYGPA